MSTPFDNNYILNKKKELLQAFIAELGFITLENSNYLSYSQIQNEEMEQRVIQMLPALRTVFQTYDIRSITRRRNDKRFVLNLLRQLLKHMNYSLESKTYHLIKDGRLTSSTKYKIVPIVLHLEEPVPESPQESSLDYHEQI
jgi:hypothetical protein